MISETMLNTVIIFNIILDIGGIIYVCTTKRASVKSKILMTAFFALSLVIVLGINGYPGCAKNIVTRTVEFITSGYIGAKQ